MRKRRPPATRARALFSFQLYVAGDAPNSALALANLKSMCKACLPDLHHIEIVNVLREPRRALVNGIRMTPTLIKLSPIPVRRIVGTLCERSSVMLALGLTGPPQ